MRLHLMILSLLRLTIATLIVSTGFRGTDLLAGEFAEATGNYGGIIQPAGFDPINAGLVTVKLEAAGQFSGTLIWRSVKYAFKGQFEAETLVFTKSIARAGTDNVRLALSLTLSPSERKISAAVDENADGSTVLSASGTLSGAPPDPEIGAALAGSINASFIDSPGYGKTQEIPGDGFAIARIGTTKNRAARFVGRLPDAVPFSAGSALRGVEFSILSRLYRPRPKGSGQLAGLITADEAAALQSVVIWGKRPGADPKYYKDGFLTGAGLAGKPYPSLRSTAPPPIGVQPGPINARLVLKGGNLGHDANGEDLKIEIRIRINAAGVKILDDENALQVTMQTNAAGATFKGTFIHPITQRLTKFRGGFQASIGATPGEGRGNFKGSVTPERLAAGELPESGSVRVVVAP